VRSLLLTLPALRGESVGVRGYFRKFGQSECAESPPHPEFSPDRVIGPAAGVWYTDTLPSL
jgi:hypothetical protein